MDPSSSRNEGPSAMSPAALSLLGVLVAPAAEAVPVAPEPGEPQQTPVHATPDPFAPVGEVGEVGEAADDGTFEIGGFMKRTPPPPPPPPPALDTVPEPVDPPDPVAESRLVWGFHRPVAPWKRRGLIASAAIVGVAIVTGSVARHRWRRWEGDVVNRAVEIDLHLSYPNSNSMGLCRANVTSSQGSRVEVVDFELAQSCVRFRRGVAIDRASVAVGIVGALSVVTFGVLHAVRRVPARRVEARSDGFAVRF